MHAVALEQRRVEEWGEVEDIQLTGAVLEVGNKDFGIFVRVPGQLKSQKKINY